MFWLLFQLCSCFLCRDTNGFVTRENFLKQTVTRNLNMVYSLTLIYLGGKNELCRIFLRAITINSSHVWPWHVVTSNCTSLMLNNKAEATVPVPVLTELEYRHHTFVWRVYSHACTVGRVAISQKQSSRRTSKPNGKKLKPSKTI